MDPGATLDPPVDLEITQNGNSLLLSGTLTGLNIFDFITGGASFAVTRQRSTSTSTATATRSPASSSTTPVC